MRGLTFRDESTNGALGDALRPDYSALTKGDGPSRRGGSSQTENDREPWNEQSSSDVSPLGLMGAGGGIVTSSV